FPAAVIEVVELVHVRAVAAGHLGNLVAPDERSETVELTLLVDLVEDGALVGESARDTEDLGAAGQAQLPSAIVFEAPPAPPVLVIGGPPLADGLPAGPTEPSLHPDSKKQQSGTQRPVMVAQCNRTPRPAHRAARARRFVACPAENPYNRGKIG